jgi:hypothetical protein
LELIANAEVRKFHFQGNFQQTVAGADQGLKTFEVWRLNLAPGNDIPASRDQGEVAGLTLRGIGFIAVDEPSVEIKPDTTPVIPHTDSCQIL